MEREWLSLPVSEGILDLVCRAVEWLAVEVPALDVVSKVRPRSAC